MPQGKVKWFSTEKAFGFIEQDNENDIFVHVTGLADGVTMIDKDMLVEYEVEQGRKGPQATSVKPVSAPVAPAAAEPEAESEVETDVEAEVDVEAEPEVEVEVEVEAEVEAETDVEVEAEADVEVENDAEAE